MQSLQHRDHITTLANAKHALSRDNEFNKNPDGVARGGLVFRIESAPRRCLMQIHNVRNEMLLLRDAPRDPINAKEKLLRLALS